MSLSDRTAHPSPASGVSRLLSVECPAKINLHLRVGPTRADGFHPLLSWMVTVGLFDRLELRSTSATVADGPSAIRLACDAPGVPSDERNLVVRMVRARAEHRLAQGLAVPSALDATLHKVIPHGAGLGGGSSDGAFALLAAERLWTGQSASAADLPELAAFAAKFGSDIPFFVHGPSCVCSGRGEIIRPTPPPTLAKWAVLILPPITMPTPDVYRRFDAMKLGRTEDIEQEPNWNAWAALPPAELMDRLVNDLETPAFDLRPDLADLRRQAERIAGRTVRMSGSGSSLFTLFAHRDEATATKERLAADLKIRTELAEAGVAARWSE